MNGDFALKELLVFRAAPDTGTHSIFRRWCSRGTNGGVSVDVDEVIPNSEGVRLIPRKDRMAPQALLLRVLGHCTSGRERATFPQDGPYLVCRLFGPARSGYNHHAGL